MRCIDFIVSIDFYSNNTRASRKKRVWLKGVAA